jgi:hypothetical protein
VAYYGFHGLGEERAATATAALLAPIGNALRRASAGGVPDTVGRQRFAIGFDRTSQTPTHEALQLGEVCQPTGVLFLFFAVRLGVWHRRSYLRLEKVVAQAGPCPS